MSKKYKWTEQENKALIKIYKRNTQVCWETVSFSLFEDKNISRTPEACRKQWEKLQKEKDHGTTKIGEWCYEYRRITPDTIAEAEKEFNEAIEDHLSHQPKKKPFDLVDWIIILSCVATVLTLIFRP